MVKTITDANLSSVLDENEITVIDFWAEWCGPCRMLSPIIDSVASDNGDIAVGKVNVDDESSLSQTFGVRNIPTVLFLKQGKVVNKLIGVNSAVKIQKVIDSIK